MEKELVQWISVKDRLPEIDEWVVVHKMDIQTKYDYYTQYLVVCRHIAFEYKLKDGWIRCEYKIDDCDGGLVAFQDSNGTIKNGPDVFEQIHDKIPTSWDWFHVDYEINKDEVEFWLPIPKRDE